MSEHKPEKSQRGRHAAPEPLVATDRAAATQQPVRPIDASRAFTIERKRHPLKVLGITVGVLVALLAIAYVGVAVYFTGHFMPNSTVSGLNVSLMSSSDAERVLTDSVEDYALSIDGQGFSLKLTATDAGLSIDERGVVRDMLSDVNPWMWPFELHRDHDETEKLVATYNSSGLENAVRSAVDTFNESAKQPKDASVVYDEQRASFVITPEAMGTALDADAVVEAADAAVADLSSRVRLTSKQLLAPTVLSDDERLFVAADEANVMIQANLSLVMAETVAATVDASLVSQWVRLDDDLSVALDEDALKAWVEQLSSSCSTVGTQRTYTRPDGEELTVSGGTYGWKVDGGALLALVSDAVANGLNESADIPCVQVAETYSGEGEQDWGSRYMDVDLYGQHARFYDDAGSLVWESDIVTGKPDGEHDTPEGVYMVNAKESPSKLVGYNGDEKIYETEVRYWMPFVGNYIGFHDADWQPAFGGALYTEGAGSHGCVNLPPDQAATLYDLLMPGDTVVVHW